MLPKMHPAAIYLSPTLPFFPHVSQPKGLFDRNSPLEAGEGKAIGQWTWLVCFSCSSRSAFTRGVMHSRFTKARNPITMFHKYSNGSTLQLCSLGRRGELVLPWGWGLRQWEGEGLCHPRLDFMKTCFSTACCKDKLVGARAHSWLLWDWSVQVSF